MMIIYLIGSFWSVVLFLILSIVISDELDTIFEFNKIGIIASAALSWFLVTILTPLLFLYVSLKIFQKIKLK